MSENFSIGNNNSVGGSPSKKIKFGDSNSPVEFDPANFFNVENSLDEPCTEFLKRFDENNNGVLDENEPLMAELALRQATGLDYVLDDEEFLSFIGEANHSLTVEKLRASMLQYIEETREDVEIYDRDDGAATVYIHDDGSALAIEETNGVRIIEIRDKDKNVVEYVVFKGKYKSGEDEEDSYHVVEMARLDKNGMQTMAAMACDDDSIAPKVTAAQSDAAEEKEDDPKSRVSYNRVDYDYYADGNLKETSEQTVLFSGIKTKEQKKYQRNGKDKEYFKIETDYGTKKESIEVFYAPQGFPIKQKWVTKEDDTIEEKIFDWNSSSHLIESTDHILSDVSNPDVPIAYNHKTYENGVVKNSVTKKAQYTLEESYEGANVEQRDDNIPNKIILKDSSGNIIRITTNDINEKGVLTGQTIEDKIAGTTTKYDFSDMNGEYEIFYQGGVGNCFKMQTITSFSMTEPGRKVLDNLVSKTETVDENGIKHTTYHIKYPALPEAKKYLTEHFGINDEDMMFPSDNVYDVTDEEIKKASSPANAGNIFSYGDKDVLPLELAYIQFRFNSSDTIKKAGLADKYSEDEVTFITGMDGHKENISYGGQSAVTMYLMSGKKPDVYFTSSNSIPICISDISSDVIKLDPKGRALIQNDYFELESDCINKKYSNFDELMDILRQDTDEDGLFKSTAAYVGLAISEYYANEKTYKPGFHAFCIKGIKDNNVLLIDPTNPTRKLTMDIDDMRIATFQMGGLYLGEEEAQAE